MRYLLPSVVRTLYFQPADIDMPEGGDARHLLYHFNLAPMDVQELTATVHEDVILYSLTGNFTGASGPAVNVFTQIYQVHNGQQIPLFSKPSPLSIAFGTGARPNPFIPTRFLPAGDSMTIKVRSQDRNAALKVECALFGATVNWNNVDRFQREVLKSKRRLMDSWEQETTPMTATRRWPVHLSPILTNYPLPGAPAVVIQSYTVPPGQNTHFYAHGLQHNGSNPPEISNSGVIWRFLVNGWPLEGLGVVTAQIGAFATPARTTIPLSENDVFQVTVELPAGSPGQEGSCGYSADGWTAPTNTKGTSSTTTGTLQ